MPSALTYPGVYIEEIPSGVRTITGVATSIAAFVGRTLRGPANEPVLITSYADFERKFGGLWTESTLSYAVRDYFRNGGAQAVIVRAFAPDLPATPAPTPETPPGPETGAAPTRTEPPAATATTAPTPPTASSSDCIAVVQADPTNLVLQAASPGSWGNRLRARIVTAAAEVDPSDPTAFNLTVALVRHDSTGKVLDVSETEVFRNVSLMAGHARRVDKVLKTESKLVVASSFTPRTARTLPTPHANPAATILGTPLIPAVPGVGGAPGTPEVPAVPTRTFGLWENNNTSVAVLATGGGNDGNVLTRAALTGPGTEAARRGLYALDNADLFNLLCVPPHAQGNDIENQLVEDATEYCTKRRAVMLIDSPYSWTTRAEAVSGISAVGSASRNAAIFFPRISAPDPLKNNQIANFVPCGAIAGVIARTDVERGVWKAPAGLAATLIGAPDLSVKLDEGDIGQLNPLGINCLRAMPEVGRVIWGSRTREGADRLASEWKYLPVRRTTLFIEESLYRGTHWVVFEPNDEPLWSSIRLNVGGFMHSLFRQGAFQGKTAREAYEVKCDGETTTQDDINRGVVNIVVRFAPLKPAEFVVIKIQQLAGQVQA